MTTFDNHLEEGGKKFQRRQEENQENMWYYDNFS
jgi:hypothetical protein